MPKLRTFIEEMVLGLCLVVLATSMVGATDQITVGQILYFLSPEGRGVELAPGTYEVSQGESESGDVLLLMSDGFPELFNEKKEILDYYRAKEIFGSVAELSSHKIIDKLCNEADNWQGDAQQEDDITFVVVKVNED